MKRPARILYHLCRLLLGGLFFYAGVVKADDPVAFAGQVANYQLLPYAWNYLVAATLPYIELFCGLLLLLDKRVRPASLVLAGLNLVFMLALASLLYRGIDIDCGCFNPDAADKTTPLMALLRDLGIMLLIAACWLLRSRQQPAEPD